jgi:hypothetical protein
VGVKVVIRYIQNSWWIAHAGSYQNAFRKSFKTRAEALVFAEKYGCRVVYYEYDQLQSDTGGGE